MEPAYSVAYRIPWIANKELDFLSWISWLVFSIDFLLWIISESSIHPRLCSWPWLNSHRGKYGCSGRYVKFNIDIFDPKEKIIFSLTMWFSVLVSSSGGSAVTLFQTKELAAAGTYFAKVLISRVRVSQSSENHRRWEEEVDHNTVKLTESIQNDC